MALAVRELELVLIARDHASATIARVGGALTIMGGALAYAGIKAVSEFGEMAREAAEFERGIALAVTHADGLGATIENVADIVNRVGKTLPVPFEELTESLYDIFSTFTSDQLSSLEDAEVILSAFAESAIAGQAPIQDIGRAVIGWINALDQPATLENITRILDIQFELVRKGAGTTTEFAGVIGKSIPAFVAANQSTEVFGGSLAFLTKNSLSAAMASTSAARAVELMFSAKAIKGLGDIGIAIEDDNGKFRSMVDILRDLQPIYKGLTDAQWKIKFKEIFGTGRIQARRFFDLVLPNFAEFEELVKDMETSAGGVADAFQLMFDQPLSQLDLFRNKWELLRRELGEAFLQKMETFLFPALDRFFEWWDKLDQAVKDNIATWALWGVGIIIATGILMAFLGIGMLVFALLKAFSGTTALAGLAKLLTALGWIGLIIALIVAAAALIYANWDKVWPFLVGLWDTLTEAARNFYESNKKWIAEMLEKARTIWAKLQELWEAFLGFIGRLWVAVWKELLAFWERWGDDIKKVWEAVWGWIKEIFLAAMDVIIGVLDWFIALFEGDWEGLWEATKDIAAAIWKIMQATWKIFLAVLAFLWKVAWDWIKTYAKIIWNWIFKYLKKIWNWIARTAADIWNGIVDFFVGIWDSIVGTAKDTLEGTGGLLEFFQKLPGRIIDAVSDLAVRFIRWIGRALRALFRAAARYGSTTLIPFFEKLPDRIIAALGDALEWLWDTGVAILTGLWDGLVWMWDQLVSPWFSDRESATTGAFTNVIGWLYNIGLAILTGLWNGIVWVWDNLIWIWLTDLSNKIPEATGDLWNALWKAGKDILRGLLDGIEIYWKDTVKPWLKSLPRLAKEAVVKPIDWFNDHGKDIIQGMWDGIQEIWDNLYIWFENLPALIVETVGDLKDLLLQTGKDAIEGLGNGLIWFWDNSVWPWLNDLRTFSIKDAVGDLKDILFEQGEDSNEGLWNGMQNTWDNDIFPWLAWIRDKGIVAAVGYLGDTLWTKGRELLVGFANSLNSYFYGTVVPWFRNLPFHIYTAIGNLNATLYARGKEVLQGLWNGMGARWGEMITWIWDIKNKIVTAIGSLGGILYSAGKAAMQGLWNGLKSKWESIKSWLSGLKRLIPSWKGPISDDLKILVNNGEAIMMGLQRGMEREFTNSIVPLLKRYAQDDISDLFNARSYGMGSDTTNNNDYGQNIQFGDIITQADPDEIAASIAWQLRMV